MERKAADSAHLAATTRSEDNAQRAASGTAEWVQQPGSCATQPINPYIAGNPVGDSPAFVGRDDVLRAVYRVLRDPQHNGIVLYGQRRIGKTSILQHLVARLPEKGGYRPVYLDLQDKAKWPLGDVIMSLAREIAATLQLPEPVAEGDPASWFRMRWLPMTLGALPAGIALVILLDEFDVLADVRAEHAASAFFPYLRELLAETRGRMRFVFVIGRNIDDLAHIAQSVFKSLPAQRVSLLSREDAERLIRMSEANKSLGWTEEAIETAWELTHGHPYLLQQLCWQTWDSLCEKASPSRRITREEIEAAIPGTLDMSRNALDWLWGGLPPAERVVVSALAKAGPRAISQEELEQLLHESGVRVVLRELREAPQLLQAWDLIEPADGGYRFRVELLRQWLARFKALSRVQKELDYIEPQAERLYRAGEGDYKAGDLNSAEVLLRRALVLNPSHASASELLAEILFSRGDLTETRRLLEQLYEINPSAARARLAQVLMAQAEASPVEDDQLALYERVLAMQRHPAAESARKKIWKERGDRVYDAGHLEQALEAYHAAGLLELEQKTRDVLRSRNFAAAKDRLRLLENEELYGEAREEAVRLAAEYPDLEAWEPVINRLHLRCQVMAEYSHAIGALAAGDSDTASRSLLAVLSLDLHFKDAAVRLCELATGSSHSNPGEVDAVLYEENETTKMLDLLTAKPAEQEPQPQVIQAQIAQTSQHNFFELQEQSSAETAKARGPRGLETSVQSSATQSTQSASIEGNTRIKREQSTNSHFQETSKQTANTPRRHTRTMTVALLVVGFAVGIAARSFPSQNGSIETIRPAGQMDHGVVRDRPDRSNIDLNKIQAELRDTKFKLGNEQARSKRLIEEGSLYVESVSLLCEARRDKEECADPKDQDKFFSSKTFTVNFIAQIRNNATGVLALRGYLCVKYVNPDKKTEKTKQYPLGWVSRDKECTLEFPVNDSGLPRVEQKSLGLNDMSFGVEYRWGMAGLPLRPGLWNIEFWWNGKKIGGKPFRMVE